MELALVGTIPKQKIHVRKSARINQWICATYLEDPSFFMIFQSDLRNTVKPHDLWVFQQLQLHGIFANSLNYFTYEARTIGQKTGSKTITIN